MPRHLDLELLRTLVAIADCGGFTRAAERLHRTQSAVSLQMQRLEETVGVPLFRAAGRQRLPTEQGEVLIGYARRLLAIHDQALGALNGTQLEGSVRFGTAQAFTEQSLPTVLARFARLHPNVRLEVRVDGNQKLIDAVKAGQLDLALVMQRPGAGGEPLRRLPLQWLVGDEACLTAPAVPLALFEAPCPFRAMALEALEREQRGWRIAYTSPSLPGLLAAVRAGLGVTAQTALSITPGLRPVAAEAGLPPLGEVEIALHQHPRADDAAIAPLATLVRGVVNELA
jgi:DNA-binding transcriptional LysR family regulator